MKHRYMFAQRNWIIVMGLLLGTAQSMFAQGDRGRADDLLFNENYEAALTEYLLVLEDHPEDALVNYNIGVCYVNSDFEKHKSIKYFQKTLFYDRYATNAYYMMGKAYQYALEFDKAIDMFNKYKNEGGGDIAEEDVEREIEYCENGYELVKFPVQVEFENLGAHVNSPYADFFPFVPINESFLAFSSRRDDGSRMQNNGQFASNVYISHVDKGEYTKAVPIGDNINTDDGNEVIVGLDGMGDKMMFHFVNQENNSLLLSSEFTNGEVSDPKVVDDRINTKKNLDDKYKPIAVSMSADGNTLYFAADRKDGYGGTDIYIARMLPIGKWGVPQNLGPDVNTEYDEDFPNIAPDGKTLYFSSRGHFSMGGFDIFKANINEETGQFGNTRNIGYPVNSVGDDMNYRVAQSGRYGYITSVRPEGYGHEDIYRLTFKEVEPEFTVIKGVVSGKGGRELVDPAITVSDMTTGELFGVYAPNPRSMRYILILPPGEYEVLIEADGFETITKNVAVYGKSSFKSEIDEDIVMSPE